MIVKKFNYIMVLAIILQMFVPFGGAVKLDAKELKGSECFTYSLSSNVTSVFEGTQLQVNFEYESVEPACAPEEIEGQQIVIDFSPLVDSDTDVSASVDSEVFDIDISSTGVVTLTFKDLSSEGETLVGFGGNAVFTINVKSVDETEEVVISDSVGNDITITINDDTGEIVNTNKVSTPDYAAVGDTVEYMVLINGDNNHVDSFHGVDSHSAGMEYVPGSFLVQEDNTWVDMTDNFTYSINSDGNLVVDSVEPFDTRMLIYYSMEITSQQETYHNEFEANYGTVVDSVGDDVWFDMDGGSWIDYTHGNIEITKVDEDGNTLAGAEFDILDSTGSVVDHVVTDSDGFATSVALPLGDYTVVETAAPDGYILDTTAYPVTISDTDADMIFELTIENELATGNIQITKVDEDGNTLAGAEFDILDSEGTIVDHVVTDSDGLATSIDLPLGDYTVVETVAPDGYVLDATAYPVTITDTDADMVFELTIENELATGNIQITKVDEDGNTLAGAEFDILDSEGNVVDHVVTDSDGLATSIDLPLGDYTVVETAAPDGYRLDETPHQMTITTSGQTVEIEIENILMQTPDITLPEVTRVGNIQITKVDEDGNTLAGAEFDILDSEGNVVDHVVTDSDGLATTIDIPLGEYTVVETVAPDGYILDKTPHQVTITNSGQTVEIEVENVLMQTPDITLPEVTRIGNIQITKVDEDGNTLSGAEFDILDSEGTVVDHVVTDSDGLATTIDLPLGEYTVVETVAPEGYILDDTPYQVTIANSGQTVELEVINIQESEIGGGKDPESEIKSEPNDEVKSEPSDEPELATTGSSATLIVLSLSAFIVFLFKTKKYVNN